MTQTSLRLDFPNSSGQKLAAKLELPADETRAFAIFAHCFTCSKDSAAATRISRALAERGIAVLRFDFTGLGGSDGDFANTNFSSNVADLVAAADFLRKEYQAPAFLIGHSLGGAAVLAARAGIPEVVAVATIGAPSDPKHLKHIFGEQLEAQIQAAGHGTVQLAGRAFEIQSQFLTDLEKQRLSESTANLDAALLVLHSPSDTVVGIDHARRIYQAAHHPKSFVSLDGADHLLSERRDAEFAAEMLATWVGRYLPEPAASAPEAAPSEPHAAAVHVVELGHFEQRITAGHHRLQADEPIALGGTDRGPSPYGLLLAALGACTSMTMRMYADHKKWPLTGIEVALAHQKIHAADCEACETKDGKLDHIQRDIRLFGELDTTQRERLIEIANRCPVHRTLMGTKEVTTTLVENAD